jgi:hypothetical protein
MEGELRVQPPETVRRFKAVLKAVPRMRGVGFVIQPWEKEGITREEWERKREREVNNAM